MAELCSLADGRGLNHLYRYFTGTLFLTFSTCPIKPANFHAGHWNGNCYQHPELEDSSRSCLRHFGSGYARHPPILQTRWDTQAHPNLRNLRLDVRRCNLHHVLHRAFIHIRRRGPGFQGLSPIKTNFRQRRVSLLLPPECLNMFTNLQTVFTNPVHS